VRIDFSRDRDSCPRIPPAFVVSHGAKLCTAGLACILGLSACGAAANDRQQVEQVYDAGGRLQLLKLDSNGNGKVDTVSYMDGPRIMRIELDGNEDGVIDRWEYYDADQQIEKVGLSRAQDGKVDSWAFYTEDGTLSRLEVSTRRDGTANRIEFYEKGVLARAEEDTNGDALVDKWEQFEGTRLASVSFDTKQLGRADRRLIYGADGTVRLEEASGDDGRFVPAGQPAKR